MKCLKWLVTGMIFVALTSAAYATEPDENGFVFPVTMACSMEQAMEQAAENDRQYADTGFADVDYPVISVADAMRQSDAQALENETQYGDETIANNAFHGVSVAEAMRQSDVQATENEAQFSYEMFAYEVPPVDLDQQNGDDFADIVAAEQSIAQLDESAKQHETQLLAFK